MTGDELAALLEKDEVALLDVRSHEEYAGEAGLSVRPVPGSHPRRGPPGPERDLRGRRQDHGSARVTRHPGGSARRRLLPLGPAVGDRRRASAYGGRRRRQLRGLVARVVASGRVRLSATARNRPHSSRPSSFQAAMRCSLSARSVSTSIGPSSFGSAVRSHSARSSGVTSGWNWIPQADPDPEPLQAAVVARQRESALRELEVVAVPLERVEALGRPAEHGVVGSLRRQLDVEPADLGARHPPYRRAERLGHELAAQAHPERRHAVREEALEKRVLLRSQPWRSSWSTCIAPPKTSTAP